LSFRRRQTRPGDPAPLPKDFQLIESTTKKNWAAMVNERRRVDRDRSSAIGSVLAVSLGQKGGTHRWYMHDWPVGEKALFLRRF
jgi:hypothetical protein